MLDIKEVISILCKYLSDTIGSTLTPEHFRLAKYNKNSEDLVSTVETTMFFDKVMKLVMIFYFCLKIFIVR